MEAGELRAIVELVRDGPRLRVCGMSMRPFLRPCDEIRVEPVLPEDLRLFDIAVFECDGVLVAHRVVRLGRGYVVLRGDGATGPGREVSVERILGRVVARVRHGRECRAGALRWRLESLWSLIFSIFRGVFRSVRRWLQ